MKQPWGQHPIARDRYVAQSSYRGVDFGFQVDTPDAAEAFVCALARVDGIAAIGRDWDYYNRSNSRTVRTNWKVFLYFFWITAAGGLIL
jgi:hypothetical protein